MNETTTKNIHIITEGGVIPEECVNNPYENLVAFKKPAAKGMTEYQNTRMDYDLSIGNAERITAEVQETLDNLAELVIPLRDEIDKARVKQSHWVGAVDTIRNIATLLSHQLDDLQNDISLSKAAVKKLTDNFKEGADDAGKEV